MEMVYVDAGERRPGRFTRAVGMMAHGEDQQCLQQRAYGDFQSTANGIKMSDQNRRSFDAKFDGNDYLVLGDPGPHQGFAEADCNPRD
jgi:hypothetical protein